jgi:hypothetical protein
MAALDSTGLGFIPGFVDSRLYALGSSSSLPTLRSLDLENGDKEEFS